MAARAVVNEVPLRELHRLNEQHIFNKTAFTARAFAHDQYRLLGREQQFHDVLVANCVIRRNHNVLDQPLRRNHLVERQVHARDTFVQVELHPLVRV